MMKDKELSIEREERVEREADRVRPEWNPTGDLSWKRAEGSKVLSSGERAGGATVLLSGERAGSETVLLSGTPEKRAPCLRSEDTGEVTPITGNPFYVGSEEAMNQFVLNVPTISRQHAVLYRRREEDGYSIEDLHSTNGTWVDGHKLSGRDSVLLRDGASIRFAKERYLYQLL